MYAKVFASMWDGTLYGQWEAWSVFVFLLAHSDREGFVDMHPKAIAARSGLPLESVERGLIVLESEDPQSRSTELEGRRLERIDAHRPWGWRIVNYLKYREFQDADTVRAQTRERVRRHRAKNKLDNATVTPVTEGNGQKRHAEVDVEAISEAKASSCHSEGDDLSVDDWFNQYLWPVCPRRRGCSKAKALRACRAVFRSTPKSQHDALGDTMIAGILAYAASVEGRDPEHIAHPATLINGRIWETLHEPA